MTKIALEVKIEGLVHGVLFRATMTDVAKRHKVNGWVKNVGDGSVEAHVEGEEGAVMEVIRWAKSGPPRARVDALRAAESDFRNLRGFRILG